MIKVQITDTEDVSHCLTLEGETVLISTVNETATTADTDGYVIGSNKHSNIVALLSTAARAVRSGLEDCRPCREKTVELVLYELMIRGAETDVSLAEDETDWRLKALQNPPVDPLARTAQPELKTAEA